MVVVPPRRVVIGLIVRVTLRDPPSDVGNTLLDVFATGAKGETRQRMIVTRGTTFVRGLALCNGCVGLRSACGYICVSNQEQKCTSNFGLESQRKP
jgi:hypothetical protein